MAAGYSSRANTYKMTLPLEHMTILEQTISKFEGLISRAIIVAGFQAEIIEEEIAEISNKNAYSFQMKFVYNENFDQGMFSSIQKGCREVSDQAFFLTPGDCPLVKKETIQLIAMQRGDVVIPSFNYKGGHPIKLSSEVKQRILDTDSKGILRTVLASYERNYVNTDDPGVIMDVDTPDDYQKAMDYYKTKMSHLPLWG
ncbi:nucleotidyltransferase family protein [Neobacillus rhizophilus]|uniref:NTP transferase domain-containing protein n=1 Tax=Neobacillus rhizophilus TaxID=2833579 RepID=A0A942U7Y6_9BACI|nr:NTP transferase domain-containing protein [Neobacillus rhizophilus]MBS4214202.1 NTP transferase domain-containing protein [Neobacillus rhizophilus]MBU8916007.1 NTP transferase domain-containing protein [Bacillus sp. FJAT-29953]